MTVSSIDALRQSELFTDLVDEELGKIAVRCRRLRYRAGEVIFHQGDPGLALFVVTEGEVRIGLEALPGEDVVPTLVRVSEAFGELALLDGRPRSATATAALASEVLMLSRDDFLALLAAEPAVTRAVLRALADMIRRTNERLAEVVLSVHTRLARRLLELADEYGVTRKDGILINREVTDVELAGLTGLHRVEVERHLANYQYEDLIRMEEGKIILRQPQKLAIWAHSK